MSKQNDLRNFFDERNAEMDQEPFSSACSKSEKSESSKKSSPEKRSEIPIQMISSVQRVEIRK